ncbi:MAG: pyridoxamine 5'-phosphate oxidase family protein [Acidimicrobiales bacterium]
MPREHHSIKFTPDELHDFLRADTRLILATVDDAGDPWGDVVPFVFRHDRVFFRVAVDTRSFANIALDPRVCCVVESMNGLSYYDIKGAIMHGVAVATTVDHQFADVDAALAGIADPVGPVGSETVVYSIDLGDSTSFSFEKIKYRYQDRALTT